MRRLEEAGRDVDSRRAAVATAVERRRSHVERIAAAEADRVSQEARLQAATAAKDALGAVAACLASRDARLKRAAAEKRKTTEVSIRALEGACASLTHQASDAERRARQAELAKTRSLLFHEQLRAKLAQGGQLRVRKRYVESLVTERVVGLYKSGLGA